jgi:dodecin
MQKHVYSVSEIVGSSPDSVDDAIRNAVRTASGSLRNLEWFEVTQIRGHIEDRDVGHFQVMLKIGFRYEDASK